MEQGLAPIAPSGPPPIEVLSHLNWVYTGFWRLSNARPQGFNGPLRIPVSEIEAYCRLKDLDYSRRQDFLFYVERLDHAWMEHIKKLQKEEERKNDLKNKSTGRPPGRR